MAYTLVNPYCTLAALKECLKRDQTDTDNEDALNRAICEASRWIDKYLGRDFFYHDHSTSPLLFDDESDIVGDKLFFPYSPVIGITEVSVGGTVWTSGTEYRLVQPANGVEYLLNLWGDWALYQPDGRAQIKGTFGYFQASTAVVPSGIPVHIGWAATEIAAAFSGQNRKQVAGLDGQALDVLSNTIPKSVFEVLGKSPSFAVMV